MPIELIFLSICFVMVVSFIIYSIYSYRTYKNIANEITKKLMELIAENNKETLKIVEDSLEALLEKKAACFNDEFSKIISGYEFETAKELALKKELEIFNENMQKIIKE